MPELAELPYAIEEIDRLEKLCQALGLDPIKLREQGREAVLKQLTECTIFHFAGHGRSDPLDPFGSGLILADGLLTVADLRDNKLKLRGHFLGYLSACLTGANDVDDLIDESIHLISTCQLAGFRHVIGTLWQVLDATCVEVAEFVYKNIVKEGLTDNSVCSGLHEALVSLRDTWAEREFAGISNVVNVEDKKVDQKRGPRDGTLRLKKASEKEASEGRLDSLRSLWTLIIDTVALCPSRSSRGLCLW